MSEMRDLFAYADAAPIAQADEPAVIAAAQAGDSGAIERLLIAYGPAIRSAVSTYAQSSEDEDDVQQTAALGVLEAIRRHRPEEGARLAGTVRQTIAEKMGELFADAAPFHVPARTLKRFFGICRAADGDMVAAREAAPSHEMSVETFDAIHAGMSSASLEALSTTDEGQPVDVASFSLFTTAEPVADVEDRILAQFALDAVEGEERDVAEMQYGFTPIVEEIDGVNVQLLHLPSDREIGGALGLTRSTVQRRGKSALGKMRHALGVVNKPAEAPAPFQLSQSERTAIMRRDDYTCQICLFPVRISGDSTRYDAPEIDHIKEQRHFKAGEESLRDDPANLRLAHRVCNNDRNRGLTDAEICRKNSGLFA